MADSKKQIAKLQKRLNESRQADKPGSLDAQRILNELGGPGN